MDSTLTTINDYKCIVTISMFCYNKGKIPQMVPLSVNNKNT